MKITCTARHNGETKTFPISDKGSLLEELRAHKVPVPFSCGGEGVCTTCRVIIISGEVSPRTELERERANERGYDENERLSCQCKAESSFIELKIP